MTEKEAFITIKLKDGHVLELGMKCLDSYNCDLTLHGHFGALKRAAKNNEVYESGDFWVDTKEIAFLLFNH